MDHQSSAALQQFRNLVGIKFQLYNSLFTSLPFHRIEKTGILLSLLLTNCEDGYRKKQSPEEIIDDFFRKHTSYTSEQEKLDLLFRFVQYAERQVVLFDALEDAAFRYVNDMNGTGTLKHLASEVEQTQKQEELIQRLKDFSIRLVLTAHPPQFYPGTVLGIIHDLAKSLAENNTSQINMYLQQLGKTPFFKKQKPTPYDEAFSLVWYLENVFYPAAGRIAGFLKNYFPTAVSSDNPVIRMGFWPGGDRDGNPFVTVDTTKKVADALRGSIIKCYYLEVRKIRRRLTFEGVETVLAELETQLYNNIFIPGLRTDLTKKNILETLAQIRNTLIHQHNGLFVHLVEGLINKVEIFGLHFASLDIRQESSVHGQILEAIFTPKSPNAYTKASASAQRDYAALTENEKMELLGNIDYTVDAMQFTGGIEQDTLQTIQAIKEIQNSNGKEGSHSYIISQCSK